MIIIILYEHALEDVEDFRDVTFHFNEDVTIIGISAMQDRNFEFDVHRRRMCI